MFQQATTAAATHTSATSHDIGGAPAVEARPMVGNGGAPKEAAGVLGHYADAGSALSPDLRARMEPQLGHSLDGVRVHAGGEANAAAAQLGARAFALGNDVHFGAGEYAPGSKEGDRLLAHELTHVIQGGGEVARKAAGPVEVSQPNEPAEVEADHVADDVAEGLHGGGGGAGGPPKIAAKLEGAGRKAYRQATGGPPPAPNPAGAQVAGFDFDRKAMEGKGDFEKHAFKFEKRLGSLAFGRAAPHASRLVGKARAFIEEKIQQTTAKNTEALGADQALWAAQDEVLGKLTGDPTVAGAVPKGTVQEIMMSQQEIEGRRAEYAAADAEKKKTMTLIQAPNLREQMTLVMNFASNILVPGILDDHVAGGSQLDDTIARHKLNATVVRERLAMGLEAKRKDDERKAAEAAKPEDKRAGSGGHGERKSRDPRAAPFLGEVPELAGGDAGFAATDDAAGSEDPSALKTTQAVEDQNDVRKNRGDKAKEFGLDAKQSHAENRDAGELADEGVELSDREKTHMGLTGDNAGGKTTWKEGGNDWIVQEKHVWTQAARKLGLPLVAGPSGTTTRIMNAALLMNDEDLEGVRLACIGYLLPIHAHSLVEVLAAGSAFGVPFRPDQKMYQLIKPLAPDELRAGCGIEDPATREMLFPDEAAERGIPADGGAAPAKAAS